MISAKEVAKGLGPTYTKQLQDLSKAQAAAAVRVAGLEELLSKRQSELTAAQPAAAVSATAHPMALAQGQALTGSLGALIEAIEQDLSKARVEAARAAKETYKVIERVQNRRRRIAELDRDIAKLQAERDKLAAELSA